MGSWRDDRRAELRAMCAVSPEELLLIYKAVSPTDIHNGFPSRVSFTRMIETILDCEASAQMRDDGYMGSNGDRHIVFSHTDEIVRTKSQRPPQ
jgi:hypothetical protein